MQFVLALDGTLRIRTSRHGRWTTVAGALVPPDMPHAVDSRGAETLAIFFDPDSDFGGILRSAFQDRIRWISETERFELVAIVDPQSLVTADAHEWAHQVMRALGLRAAASRRVIHPAVRDLLARLRRSGFDDDTSLEGLAKTARLSSGRLMHVFTESVGIPLRPYIGWLRVQRAACMILSGASLTEAAHGAGFSDSAHMTRTFRRRLGFTPSALRAVRCSQSVQAGEA